MAQDNNTFPLLRIGEVEYFETETVKEHPPEFLPNPFSIPYKKFKATLKNVKIIKHPKNFELKDKSLLNVVEGAGELNIDIGDIVSISSIVSPSGTSFKDNIVRKLRKSGYSYKFLGIYNL